MDDDGGAFIAVMAVFVAFFAAIIAIPMYFLYAGLNGSLGSTEGDEDKPLQHGVTKEQRRQARQRMIDKGIVEEDRWKDTESGNGS